jgi:hypothetical protein
VVRDVLRALCAGGQIDQKRNHRGNKRSSVTARLMGARAVESAKLPGRLSLPGTVNPRRIVWREASTTPSAAAAARLATKCFMA